MAHNIALVDDDRNIIASVSMALEAEGFNVKTYNDGEEGLKGILASPPDLAVLDIKMPRMDGLELLRRLRQKSKLPVIFLTSRDDEVDEVLGLQLGADDYVTKPFDPRELLSRVKNLLWRLRAQQKQKEQGTQRHFANWTLNLNKRELTTPADATQPLSAGEFHLLLALIDNAGEVLNRDQLMNKIRNREWYPDDRYIDVLVGQVRRKFRSHDPDTTFISTIHGTGYLFAPAVS